MCYKDKEKQRDYQRKHYNANKSKYAESTKNRRIRNKEFVYSMKTECRYCALKDKVCLDFHHLTGKIKNVSRLIRDAVTIEKLKLEILKCEVVCGNCHNKIHSPLELKDGSEWKGISRSRIEKRKWYLEFIKTCFCVDCGEDDRRCLEFHHLKNKTSIVSRVLSSGSPLETLKLEISKCEVLCVNCHRKKTWCV